MHTVRGSSYILLINGVSSWGTRGALICWCRSVVRTPNTILVPRDPSNRPCRHHLPAYTEAARPSLLRCFARGAFDSQQANRARFPSSVSPRARCKPSRATSLRACIGRRFRGCPVDRLQCSPPLGRNGGVRRRINLSCSNTSESCTAASPVPTFRGSPAPEIAAQD